MNTVATAKLRYLRVPPQKARWVADLIRGREVTFAKAQLSNSDKKVARHMQDLLKSAVANATQTGKVDPDLLFVKEITVNEGPILKRFDSRAQGRATRVNKRTSHITIVLGEK